MCVCDPKKKNYKEENQKKKYDTLLPVVTHMSEIDISVFNIHNVILWGLLMWEVSEHEICSSLYSLEKIR